MPNNSNTHTGISREIIMFLLLFLFLLGGYAKTEEIPDKGFFSVEESDITVHEVVDWIVTTKDNKEKPFVIVDKKQAKIHVLSKEGRVIATAPALVGEAVGDYSVPGVGDKKLCDINPYERTTPAGKFLARRGLNSDGTEVIWIDFNTAIAIHPVPSSHPQKGKLQRLQSLSSKDKRSTLGCINVTKEFYITIISPIFAQGNRFVYILPETTPINDFFKLQVENKSI